MVVITINIHLIASKPSVILAVQFRLIIFGCLKMTEIVRYLNRSYKSYKSYITKTVTTKHSSSRSAQVQGPGVSN